MMPQDDIRACLRGYQAAIDAMGRLIVTLRINGAPDAEVVRADHRMQDLQRDMSTFANRLGQ